MSERSITPEQLVAFVTGELDTAEHTLVEHAVGGEPRLADRVRHLRRTLAALAEDDTCHPRAEALGRAVALFETTPPVAMLDWLDRVQREIARVVFDSRAQLALSGFRGEVETRQLSYESDLACIDLQIVPEEDRLSDSSRARLRGQVTTSEPHVAGTVIAAPTDGRADDALLTAGEPDEHGQFLITVDSGRYAVHFEFDDGARAVTLPELDVP